MTEVDRSKPFRQMADNIDHNKGAPFGGALVIVPPDNGGEPVSTLILDQTGDAAQFWAAVKFKAELAIQELSNQQRANQAFAPRLR